MPPADQSCQQSPALVDGEPVAEPHPEAFRSLDSANACREVRIQQPVVRGLVCKTPYGCQPKPKVDSG
jgi:hypothetical protein